jgi:glucose-1-phosphate cytidylyltransferase
MKVVILAGGYGSRLSEETTLRPKPMVKIGDKPILWHIMKYYTCYGLNDFIICGGYKVSFINDYFKKNSSKIITFNIKKKRFKKYFCKKNKWQVLVVDTGLNTMTGGRLKRVKEILDNDEDKNFCLTYGDGLSDVNLKKLINFHKKNKKKATVVAVQPPARYGSLKIKKEKVIKFSEKTQNTNSWINGGFFVLRKEVIKLIKNDLSVWERRPLEYLAKKNELIAFKHKKFWMAMDTLREKKLISKIYKKGNAPWKKW